MALTQASEGGLKISNAGTNGQFLQKQSGNTGGLTWATVTAGGGGGSGTDYDDNVKVRFGTGNDLQLYHDGTRSYINNTTGALYLESGSTEIGLIKGTYASGEWMLRAINDGAVELFHDNTKKLETIANGTNIVGNLGVNRSGANKTIDIETASNANAFYLNSIGTPSNYYGRIADDGTTFLEIDASKNIKLISDSAKVQIGADQDLEIYHDGSHSVIKESGTGDLRIQTASFRLRNEDASEMMISADADGAVYLAHNGVTKLETAAGGVTVTGNIETNEHISLTGDNKKLKFGAGEDLVIYHDGSNSYIQDDGTGELRIRGTTIRLTDNDGSENFANFVDDGAVELYYDNVKKFETSAAGGSMHGNLYFDDNGRVDFGAGNDLQIYHDGSHSYINESGTGNLKIKSSRVDILNPAGDEDMIVAIENGAVELFYDGSKKLATTNYGVYSAGYSSMGNGTWAYITGDSSKSAWGNDQELQIFHDGSNSNINNSTGNLKIGCSNTVEINGYDGHAEAKFINDGAAELYFDGTKRMLTTSTGIRVEGSNIIIYGDEGTSAGILLMADQGDDAADRWRIQANQDANDLTFANDTSSHGSYLDRMTLTKEGNVSFAGTYPSDRDLKDNITTVTETSLDKISQLVPKTFTLPRFQNSRTFTGFIAQEVQPILPTLVSGTDGEQNMALDYNGVLAHAVKAITELKAEVDTLKTKVAALEAA